ncbi:hypothetical protein BGX28_008963, partial [Mortierella sp. GBA30]
ADTETIINLMTFMCYNLGKHLDMMERVRQEIFEVVSRDRKPDHNDIKSLSVLKQLSTRSFITIWQRLLTPEHASMTISYRMDTSFPSALWSSTRPT